jgi:hypothetical protein
MLEYLASYYEVEWSSPRQFRRVTYDARGDCTVNERIECDRVPAEFIVQELGQFCRPSPEVEHPHIGTAT